MISNTYNFSERKIETIQLAQIETQPVASENPLEEVVGHVFPVALSVFGICLGVWFLRSFMCICKPNEVVILSGRKRKTKDGQEIGYRVLTGGRAIRIPIVETVKRMDVTLEGRQPH